VNKIQERQQFPLFENIVRFTEIGTTEGIKWMDVVISRCRESKPNIGPGKPAKNQDKKP